MSDVNFNIPLRARRHYRDVCPTWSLCDRRFPQIQQFYLQSRSYLPFSYPDVNQSSPWAIRTLYPSIVPCRIMEEDHDGFSTKGWLYDRLYFPKIRNVNVQTTLEAFLAEVFKKHMDKVWDYDLYVGDVPWFKRHDTLEMMLSKSYNQQDMHPLQSKTAVIGFRKKRREGIVRCYHDPLRNESPSKASDCGRVARSHPEDCRHSSPHGLFWIPGTMDGQASDEMGLRSQR